MHKLKIIVANERKKAQIKSMSKDNEGKIKKAQKITADDR